LDRANTGQAAPPPADKRFEEASAILDRAEVSNLKGVWRGNILLSIGDVHLAAGRKTEARAAFQAVIDDKSLENRQRQAADESIRSIPPE